MESWADRGFRDIYNRAFWEAGAPHANSLSLYYSHIHIRPLDVIGPLLSRPWKSYVPQSPEKRPH